MKQVQHLLLFFLLIATLNTQAQVGIGTPTPNASAQLDLSSTDKGFLPPRMTRIQRNAISSPVAGLMIWCTTCSISGEMQVFNGYIWTNMMGGQTPNADTTICGQIWMLKNLDVSTYRDGSPIPKVTDPVAWAALTTGAYCYFNNDSATYAAVYGKLYNWFAVNDPRGLAPVGLHVPSSAEYFTLSTCLGVTAGGEMKEAGTSHWLTPNTGATNSSGFTGLPGGIRFAVSGSFGSLALRCNLWSSSQTDATNALSRYMEYNNTTLFMVPATLKQTGLSVRCLRD